MSFMSASRKKSAQVCMLRDSFFTKNWSDHHQEQRQLYDALTKVCERKKELVKVHDL